MNIVYFVLFLAGVVALSTYRDSLEKNRWKDAASALGLDFKEGGIFDSQTLMGSRRGKSVKVSKRTESRGSKGSGRTVYFTTVFVRIQAPCFQQLELKNHDFGDSITTFFGGDDVDTGDETFDSDFRIRSDIDARTRRCLLSSPVQSALRSLARSYENFQITEGCVRFEKVGRVKNPNEISRLVERGIDAAVVIDEAAETDRGDSEDHTSTGRELSDQSSDRAEPGESTALFPDPQPVDENDGEQPPPVPDSSAVW